MREEKIQKMNFSLQKKRKLHQLKMSEQKTICRTVFRENVLDETKATSLYEFLRDNVKWEAGIKSRKGSTRKAKMIDGDNPLMETIFPYIKKFLNELSPALSYVILGVYLNYYEDGKMYAPNHTHKGTHQLVISLGETRTLTVGKKAFQMTNGSGAIFGSSIHGVPQSDTKKGRISIATFMVPYKV